MRIRTQAQDSSPTPPTGTCSVSGNQKPRQCPSICWTVDAKVHVFFVYTTLFYSRDGRGNIKLLFVARKATSRKIFQTMLGVSFGNYFRVFGGLKDVLAWIGFKNWVIWQVLEMFTELEFIFGFLNRVLVVQSWKFIYSFCLQFEISSSKIDSVVWL